MKLRLGARRVRSASSNTLHNKTTISAVEIGNSYVPESTEHILRAREAHRPQLQEQHSAQRLEEGSEREQLADSERQVVEHEAVEPAPAEGQVRLVALQHGQAAVSGRRAQVGSVA